MEKRKDDPRVYIVAFLFLLCVLTGGVLLAVYLIYPFSNPLYLLAGMILVGIPWVFWFLAYLARCILMPCSSHSPQISREPDLYRKQSTKKNQTIISNTEESGSNDDPRSPNSDRERRVQFGVVTVFETEEEEEEDSITKRNGMQETHQLDLEGGHVGR